MLRLGPSMFINRRFYAQARPLLIIWVLEPLKPQKNHIFGLMFPAHALCWNFFFGTLRFWRFEFVQHRNPLFCIYKPNGLKWVSESVIKPLKKWNPVFTPFFCMDKPKGPKMRSKNRANRRSILVDFRDFPGEG